MIPQLINLALMLNLESYVPAVEKEPSLHINTAKFLSAGEE